MSHRLITCREYETVRVSNALVAEGHEAITEKEADALLRLDESLTIRAFERRYSGIRFLNYCGVIQVGQLTMEILPKIAETNEQERRAGLDRELLLRMIAIARDLPLFDTSAADIQLQNHHLLDLVVAHFCNVTYREFHKGLIRQYIAKEEVLRLIRGRWLVNADINHNVGRKDFAHCEFDEFTDDNPYNQAIKATLRLLISVTSPNRRLSQKLRTLDAMLPGVTDKYFAAAAVRDLPRSRLVARFETVLQFCEWFLAAQSPNVHAGAERAFGLLFDMNVLFEQFVAKILRSVIPDALQLRTQGPRTFLVRDRKTGDDRFQMKPDLCIVRRDKSVAAIIDTKWKLLDEQDQASKYGVQQSDVYQAAAYAEAYRCSRVALWYPASPNLSHQILTVFDFLRRGEELTGRNLAINSINLQPSQSGIAWKADLRDQARVMLAALLEGEPSYSPVAA